MTWVTVERPGYFGRHRNERHRGYDGRYGVGNWRLAWQMGEAVGPIDAAVLVYEDAYLIYLCQRSDTLARLLREAAGVYDDAPSNLASGLDYARQETARTHLQDIALRRCVVRLGRAFRGTQLIQIRDAASAPPVHPLSLELSPGRVPFHRPEWIIRPQLEGWWQPGSIEAWYQSNKLLQWRV